MAEYIKFRLTAAKLGVTMALAALIGGLAARGNSGPPTLNARNSSANTFLKLDGITGNTKNAFLKLELKLTKLDSALGSFEKKLVKSYYGKHTTDATFLKIDAASKKYLKIDAANTQFLKIDDASKKYLKIDGQAADSQKLGGLTSDAFVHSGNVVSKQMSIPDGTSQPVQFMGDGSVAILIGLSQPAGAPATPQLTLMNNDAVALNFTVNGAFGPNNTSGGTVSSGKTVVLVPAVQTPAVGQFDVQLFNGKKAWTLTVSAVPDGAGGHTFVGQLLIGLL